MFKWELNYLFLREIIKELKDKLMPKWNFIT